MKLRTIILLTLISLTLAACNFTLAEDVTPPPNYQSPTPPPTIGPLYPTAAPDLVAGEAIYAEKCLPCHGENGYGDGPQNQSLPVAVAPIGMADTVRAIVPADWYTIVSRGNIERFMPPFTSLSEQERWDVVGYVYNLSIEPDEYETGKTLYAANCAECHGENGEGGTARAFTDQVYMAKTSNQGLYLAITTGMGDKMPAYGDRISEADRWALASYVRTLSFSTDMAVAAMPEPTATLEPATATPTVEAAPTPEFAETPAGEVTPTDEVAATEVAPTEEVTLTEEPSAEATLENEEQAYVGTFSGLLTNGSGGGVPAGLTVTLRGYDANMATGNFTENVTINTTAQADGTFSFSNIELLPNRAFITTLELDGAEYVSEPVFMGEDLTALEVEGYQFDVPITIFDTSSDASQLSVDQMHVFLDFTDPGLIQIVEVYVVSNPTNYTIVPDASGAPVVNFTLPEGAIHLQFEGDDSGTRFVITDNGFGDTLPIPPSIGEHQVVAIYSLPYDKKVDLSHELTFNTGTIQVISPSGVDIEGDQLSAAEPRDVQGMSYDIYTTGSVSAGSEFSISISGQPSDGTDSGLDTRQSLLIGAGGLGLVLIVAGAWLYWRDRRRGDDDDDDYEDEDDYSEASSDTADDIMDAIIALDDQFRSGALSEDLYRSRRADLKARLKKLL